ncbi:MAG: hypothetical protein OSA97_10705 [Nevskia sp.]|nr:hypothetical protein [Nevskia sp.]
MDAEHTPKKKPLKRKARHGGRYEVYTRPKLYDPDRSGSTRLLQIAIILAMAGIIAALHRPLLAALTSAFPSLKR